VRDLGGVKVIYQVVIELQPSSSNINIGIVMPTIRAPIMHQNASKPIKIILIFLASVGIGFEV
jgi:hypothetical protein